MDISSVFQLSLGESRVEAFSTDRRRRWQLGTIVGRTREAIPRVDVILDNRTVLAGLPIDQIRIPENSHGV